nr:hypothetical protein [Sodalis-like endosymbiont of Proechinophthirus fluctus]
MAAVADYADDQALPLQKLDKFNYRDILIEQQEALRVEGRQNLNVNVLSRETLEGRCRGEPGKISADNYPYVWLYGAFQFAHS